MVELRGQEGTRVGRRRLLVGGAVGSSLLAMGGWAALVRTGGYGTPADGLQVLGPSEYAVVRELARRIVAPDVPEAPTADELGVAEFVDRYVAALRPRLRADFVKMLRVTEHIAPLALGYLRRFTALRPDEQDRVLSALESSSVDQLRGGFQALKSVVVMGYYRHPRTFAILGYRGPFVEGPESIDP